MTVKTGGVEEHVIIVSRMEMSTHVVEGIENTGMAKWLQELHGGL